MTAYHYWFSHTVITPFIEFTRVWREGIRFINVDGGRNDVAALRVELANATYKISAKLELGSISKTVTPNPSCNICFFPYTETGIHTPRMMSNCGHTICEQCANKLLNAKLQNVLVCPFCQKSTIVNGLAGTLPKNYALLEFTREVAQRN